MKQRGKYPNPKALHYERLIATLPKIYPDNLKGRKIKAAIGARALVCDRHFILA